MTAQPRPKRWQPATLGVGLWGAAVVAGIELAAVGSSSVGVAWAVGGLFAGLGLAVGLLAAGAETIIASAPGLRRPWPAAMVRAAPAALALIPVGQTLFEGAFAATLPGASTGAIWFPILGVGAVAVAIRICSAIMARPRGPAIVTALLLVGAAGTEAVNRTVQRSEYPDIHTLLVVVAVVGLGTAVWIVSGRRPRSARATHGVAVASAAWFAATCTWGLASPDDRFEVATSGMHAKLLVRLARATVDVDRDGYARILAGGDCNDFDAQVHPGAVDVPDNDIDEDCDGVAQTGEATAQAKQARRDYLAEADKWRETPPVRDLLARTSTMNVVLIAVDALRADVVAPGADTRAAYPNLTGLFEGSARFDLAFAPAAGTDLSMAGLLTGRIDPFASGSTTLPGQLKAHGLATYAVIPSEVLRYVGKTLLTRDLDRFQRLVNDRFERDVGSYTTSHRTTELGLELLDRHLAEQPQQRFFLWLHYFDVHEHDEVKASDRRLRQVVEHPRRLDVEGKYRALVQIVDGAVGDAIEGLQQRGVWDNTIVVFVSDHGESLREDPRLPVNHGKYVYNALVHVPVAVRVPGAAGRRVATPVSLLDVYPTVLELLGAGAPTPDAVSLLPHLVDGAPRALTERSRPLPLNESDQYGVVVWPHKLMVRPVENLTELYDLQNDFGETHNLAADRPEQIAALLGAYRALSPVVIDRTRKGRRKREREAKAADPSDD